MSTRAWVEALFGSEVWQRLRSLGGSQLNSGLLELFRERARTRSPAEVLAQFERDRFCSLGTVSPVTQARVDAALFAGASDFEDVELSPVAPLGACSAIGLTDQQRTLSALRSTEVVSDPTNVLALECAARLRSGRTTVDLATSHRVLRAQAVPPVPGSSAHFRMFALATAGREDEEQRFTRSAIARHVRAVLRGLDGLERQGYDFGQRRLELRVEARRPSLRAALEDELSAFSLPLARTVLDHAYYSGGVRFVVGVTTRGGEALPLIDGGSFDWVARLLSNQRLVFVASGLGSQLVPLRFSA
jgi:hypothetical protein